MKKASLRVKLAALFSSLLFVLVLLLLAEGAVRLVTDVKFAGNSRNLFTPDAYGNSKGNTPNVEAVSFGEKAYIDGRGFRVPRDYDESGKSFASTLLILGDSVGFGPGIVEEQTLAGRLRTSLPQTRILNSSVIGYTTWDYRNFVEAYLSRDSAPDSVYLVFCLNDVSAESARQIDAQLGKKPADAPRGFVGSAKRIPLIGKFNELLRSRSKLYLLVKNGLTDPRARYWHVDAKKYEVDDETLARRLQPVIDVAGLLAARDVAFTVLIAPYEYQLRMDTPEVWNPQRRLTRFFADHGVDVLDAAESLRGRPSDALYLPGDPMHFSESGHQLLHEIVMRHLSGQSGSHAVD